MPKFHVIARPTGTKHRQPELDITVLAADRDEEVQ